MNYKPIRFYISIILCLCVMLGLTACSGESKSNQQPSSQPDSSVVATPHPTVSVAPEEIKADDDDDPMAVNHAQPEMLKVLVGTEYLSHYDGYSEVVSVMADVIHLAREYEGMYSSLSAVLDEFSSERMSFAEDENEELYKIYNELKQDGGDTGIKLTHKEKISVKRADNRVLSFIDYCDQYSGGAHGGSTFTGYSFDSVSGKKLECKDVCTDMDKLAELVLAGIKEKYREVAFQADDETILKMVSEGEISWVLGYNELTVYFNEYDIASYADGVLSFGIAFDQNKGLIKEEYTVHPEDYSLMLTSFEPFDYDFASDGTMDSFCIEPLYEINDYGYGDVYEYNGVRAILNGVNYVDQFYTIELSCITLYHVDDKDFLFVEASSESDLPTLYIYSITSDGFERISSNISFSQRDEVYAVDDSTEYYCQVLTAPSDIEFQTRKDIIGTNFLSKHYFVSGDGYAFTNDKYYRFTSGYELTLKTDMEVKSYNAEADVISDKEDLKLSAGTEFRLMYTDGNRTVMAETEAGEWFALVVDEMKNWEIKIGGVSIDDLFEGIVYAG